VDPLPRGHWRMRASTGARGIREALCTLGNGYLRRAVPLLGQWRMIFTIPGPISPAATNRLCSNIANRVVESEDLVNCPNWLSLEFRVAEQDWFECANR